MLLVLVGLDSYTMHGLVLFFLEHLLSTNIVSDLVFDSLYLDNNLVVSIHNLVILVFL